ncbi:MAG: transposase [Magnetococcales bacterium]|nr:transposase [Magnetococcales bacterium]
MKQRFDDIFIQNTGYETLNQTLRRLHDHKNELLLVLQRPDVPLHTNGSESDIREYAKRRKVSGGTRSDSGRVCRDTFISLKKTCRKLGVSFWSYLIDRLSYAKEILPLADIVRQRAALVHSCVP